MNVFANRFVFVRLVCESFRFLFIFESFRLFVSATIKKNPCTRLSGKFVERLWELVLIIIIIIIIRVRPRSAGPKLALFGGIVDRSSTPKLGFEGRHVPLRSCRGLVEVQSPSAAHGLRRDAGLVMKTAFLAPHAPRPCLPVWPCLGHACPRVLPVTTLHDDGLL